MRIAALGGLVTLGWLGFACSSTESPSPGVAGSSGTTTGGSAAVSGSTSGGSASSGSTTGGTSAAGTQAMGGSPSAGTSAGGSSAGSSTVLPPFGPAPTDKPETVEVGVRNNCPFPIWIHAQGKQATLMPDYQPLQKGDHIWYDAPKQWEAARVTAYGDAEHQQELDKVEMTLVENGDVLNYNVTYVDWLSLPVEMISRGTGDCKKVGCYVPEEQVLSGCPDGLLDGKRCLAARTYCLGGNNDDKAYCHALDSEVERCAATKEGCEGAAGNKTANAYACDGFFGQTMYAPKWCAALNRGMLDDPENKDTSKYYQKAPYNTYAKWVHEACPGIYAFAYDDYPPNAEESGFHACSGGKELEITFCPAG